MRIDSRLTTGGTVPGAASASGSLGPVAAAGLGTVATLIVILPGFLVGGVATFLRTDLGMTPARLGIAVAVFFGGSALAAVPGGRFSERRGPERGLALAALGAAVALLTIGALANAYHTLLVALAVAGLANGVVHPAANLLLVRHVPRQYQGLAFGTKQAAILLATMLSGLAVPAVALTIGWRWAFVLAGLAAITICLYAVTREPTGRRTVDGRSIRSGDVPLAPMAGLAVAAALGAGTAVTMGSFLVDYATDAGIEPTHAGLLLAAGSLAGVVVRLTSGWLADRSLRRPLPVVAAMMAVGALGLLIMRLAHPAALVIGTIIGFGVGWGWHGLLNFAVVKANPNAPGAATAITEGGAFIGAVIVPIAFGFVATGLSYRAAWLLGAAAMALAACLVVIVTPRMNPGRPTTATALGSRGAT